MVREQEGVNSILNGNEFCFNQHGQKRTNCFSLKLVPVSLISLIALLALFTKLELESLSVVLKPSPYYLMGNKFLYIYFFKNSNLTFKIFTGTCFRGLCHILLEGARASNSCSYGQGIRFQTTELIGPLAACIPSQLPVMRIKCQLSHSRPSSITLIYFSGLASDPHRSTLTRTTFQPDLVFL